MDSPFSFSLDADELFALAVAAVVTRRIPDEVCHPVVIGAALASCTFHDVFRPLFPAVGSCTGYGLHRFRRDHGFNVVAVFSAHLLCIKLPKSAMVHAIIAAVQDLMNQDFLEDFQGRSVIKQEGLNLNDVGTVSFANAASPRLAESAVRGEPEDVAGFNGAPADLVIADVCDFFQIVHGDSPFVIARLTAGTTGLRSSGEVFRGE